MTQKQADFELFKQGYNLIKAYKHLTLEGLNEFVAIKASMNIGLSDILKTNFPEIIQIPRPKIAQFSIPDPQ
jgi:hypothetical protein